MTRDDSGSASTAGTAVELDEAMRGAFGFGVDDGAWFRQMAGRVQRPALGRLGPFELLAEAGRGGQGLVYRARQDRPAREVALKRLAAGVFATPSMRARFEREIESAAALNHPNIVAVYGTQEIDGQLVVALQWIDGVAFDRWARPEGGMVRSIAEILGVFQQICDAVKHAHQRGVIHRDLKPSNVLIDAADEPHVLDFGLASRRVDLSGDPRLTMSGAILGTPAYAPPEQLRGDTLNVDVRSDVYSLGAMLYQALTGSMPVESHLSPVELLREIERGRADEKSQQATAALDASWREAKTTRAIKDFLLDMLISAGRGGGARNATLTVREMLDRAAEKLEVAGESIEPAADAALRMTIANSYRELGLDAVAEPHYRAALELRRKIHGAESLPVAETLDALGRAYRVLGRAAEAETAVEAAWAVYEKVVPRGDPYLARAASSVALVKRSLRKFDESEKWYLEAIRRYTDCFGPQNEFLPFVTNNLGSLYVSAGRLAEAEVKFREALALSRAVHGDALHLDTLLAMSSLADVLASLGDPEFEAESLFDESYRGMVALYGTQHFRVGDLLQRYARFLAGTGRIDEALDALFQARQVFSHSDRWAEFLGAASTEATLLQNIGRTTEAMTLLLDSLDVAGARVAPGELSLAAVHLEIGAMLLETGRLDRCAEHLVCAEAIYAAGGEAGVAPLARTRALLSRLPRE